MKLKHFFPLLTSALVIACSSSGGDDGPDPISNPDPDPVVPPSAATLIFPENNTECNTGEIVSETLSNVTFEWNASQNTDTYEVTITNLNTNSASNYTTSATETTIQIARGTPFEWFVVSTANGTNATATSATWRFYNEGPGVTNYAPFPAEAIHPARGMNLPNTTTSVTLEWEASDVDNDISSYEVFFGTEENPTTSLGVTTSNSLADVSVSSGTTYYWVVVVNDSAGNSSNSEVFEFRVQ